MAGGLMLGPVLFQAFEVPERLSFGGKQRLAVHALPGGGRIVDVLGAEEGPVTWRGVFSGPGAGARVRLLEMLRRRGDVVSLSWEGWRYSVVIEALDVEATNPAWIPYRLRVCVVAAGDVAGDEGSPLFGTVAEALALGGGAGVDGRIDAAAAALGGDDARAAIAAAGALAQLVAARALLGAAERGAA